MRSFLAPRLALLLLAIGAGGACATEAGVERPLIRIASERHVGAITRVARDSDGRWLVTASADKTLMVWRMPEGERAAVLRVPIGPDAEGRLDALAMSADGALVAASGATGPAWKSGYTVYVLERESGRMAARITGLPAPVSDLSWSADRKLLAVALRDPEPGIVVFRTDTWQQIGADAAYEASVGSVEFAGNERLITASRDGLLRSYRVGRELKKIKTVKVSGGSELNVARVDKAGRKIAVNFCSSHRVSVVDAGSLEVLHAVATPEPWPIQSRYECARLAWSDDGKTLFRAGENREGGKYTLDRWGDEGRAPVETMSLASSMITDLVGAPGGDLIWSAEDGTWGRIGAGTAVFRGSIDFANTRYFRKAALGAGRFHNDMYDLAEEQVTRDSTNKVTQRSGGRLLTRESNLEHALAVSDDGNVVSFRHDRISGARLQFDVLRQEYLDATATSKPRAKPFNAGWVDLEGTGENGLLVIGTQRTPLPDRVLPSAMTLAPRGDAVYVGGPVTLTKFAADGRLLWKAAPGEKVLDLAASGDGRFVVAALNDGSLQWRRSSDGSEVVTFFPHPDGRRWVLWIPEGHYTATPGAEDLVGWQINEGPAKAPRFVRSSQLYDVFFRPDIVRAKFQGENFSELVTMTAADALRRPPPSVAFTDTPRMSEAARERICFRAESRGAGIGEVRMFHNGKLVKSDGFLREVAARPGQRLDLAQQDGAAIYRGLKRAAQARRSPITAQDKGSAHQECVEVDMIPGDNEFVAVAFNGDNTVQSAPVSARTVSRRPPEVAHLHVLAIGIDRFADPAAKLQFAAKDARDFSAMIRQKAAGLFRPEHVHVELLQDGDATKEGIRQALQRMNGRIRPWDSFVLFVASHGVLEQDQYFLVTAGFNGAMDASQLLSSNEIIALSTQVRALSQLYVFDTCHAGGVDSVVGGLYDARMSVLARKTGLHMYASAGGRELAMDGYQGNGLFTHTLLGAMRQARDTDTSSDGFVSVIELGRRARRRTIEIARELKQAQSPNIISFGRDLPLFKVDTPE